MSAADDVTAPKGAPDATPATERAALPVGLLVVTLLSMLWAGTHLSPRRALFDGVATGASPLAFFFGPWWRDAAIWWDAASFAGALGAILLAHELGHWVTARQRGVRSSLPLFLPGPPPFGTFGAVIRLDDAPMPVRSLLRVAVWGPFAGMVVAVPVLAVGLAWSEVLPLPDDPGAVTRMGSCLLMAGMEYAYFGPLEPGTDVFLHPVAFAGWAGLFVTAFNLLPIGQLDGGHVAYALFGDASRWVARGAWAMLVVLGVVLYLPWLAVAVLLRVLVGWDHPPMSTDGVARGRDRVMGWVALALFVLTFTPRPFHDPALSLW